MTGSIGRHAAVSVITPQEKGPAHEELLPIGDKENHADTGKGLIKKQVVQGVFPTNVSSSS